MDRDEHGRFAPGNQASKKENGGNGGKPKGLAERARAAVADGADLVDFYSKVFRGELGAKLEHRLEAANWFADRGWGRPRQPIDGQLGLTIEQVATLLGQQGPPTSEQ